MYRQVQPRGDENKGGKSQAPGKRQRWKWSDYGRAQGSLFMFLWTDLSVFRLKRQEGFSYLVRVIQFENQIGKMEMGFFSCTVHR